MNIRNMSFRKNFTLDKNCTLDLKPTTIELIIETEDKRMFAYHMKFPINLKTFPDELFEAAKSIQALLEHGEAK